MLERVENSDLLLSADWIAEADIPDGAIIRHVAHIVLFDEDGETGIRVNRQGTLDLLQQLGMLRLVERLLVEDSSGR